MRKMSRSADLHASDQSNRQIAAQTHRQLSQTCLSGIALNQTANLVLNMTEGGSPVTPEAVWKVNSEAVKGACWGSELPSSTLHPHLPPPALSG